MLLGPGLTTCEIRQALSHSLSSSHTHTVTLSATRASTRTHTHYSSPTLPPTHTHKEKIPKHVHWCKEERKVSTKILYGESMSTEKIAQLFFFALSSLSLLRCIRIYHLSSNIHTVWNSYFFYTSKHRAACWVMTSCTLWSLTLRLLGGPDDE